MDAQQMVLAHFEKGILAAVGVWLLIVLSSYASQPDALTKNDELMTKMKRIEAYMNTNEPEEYPMPNWAPQLKANLSPSSAGVGPFPDWAMHRRPQFLYSVEETGPGHSAKHEPPGDLALDTETRGKIIVKWQPSVDNEYVIIANYDIERRIGEDGEWESVATIDGVEESYEDSAIKSRTEYYYRVTSIAEIDRDNPVVDAEGMQLPERLEKQVSRVAGPVETARDMYIIPVTVTQVTRDDLIANANAKESAYIRVIKWDAEEGKAVAKAFNVKVNGKIGKVVKRGRKKTDYRTGAVLVDVEIKKRKRKVGGMDHMESVQWIKIKYKDGTEEECTDKDVLPDEFKKTR